MIFFFPSPISQYSESLDVIPGLLQHRCLQWGKAWWQAVEFQVAYSTLFLVSDF